MSSASQPVASLDTQAAYVEGPVLIGTCVSLVLLGVVSGQTVKFLSNSNGDSWRLRVYQAVTHFGIVEPPILLGLSLDLILIPIISFMVEAYYIHRLAALSKRNFFVLVPICTVLLSAFVLHVTVTFEEQTFAAERSIFDFVRLWQQAVTHFGIVEPPILLGLSLDLILIPIISFMVEAYYIHRLAALSKRNFFVLVPICTVLLSAFVLHVTVTFEEQTFTAERVRKVILLYEVILPVYFVGDLLLTVSTAAYLYHFRRNVLPQNATVVTQLIRLVFQTSTPATFCRTRMSRGSGMEGAIERFRENPDANRNMPLGAASALGQASASGPAAAALPLSRNSSHAGSQGIDGRAGSNSGESGSDMCFADARDVEPESARKVARRETRSDGETGSSPTSA
uniref:Integral membrane protein n=1 Tax=Mycena chlorophos TaxID=658473 RepID=A0ABQ0LX50_MYCCL|nr:predicted protein [Mycena chlorophos]